LHVTEISECTSILAVECIFQLQEATQPNQRKLFSLSLQGIEPRLEIADLVGVEDGPTRAAPLDALASSTSNVPGLVGVKHGSLAGLDCSSLRNRPRELLGIELKVFELLFIDHATGEVVGRLKCLS
jgi:hypothetical protein